MKLQIICFIFQVISQNFSISYKKLKLNFIKPVSSKSSQAQVVITIVLLYQISNNFFFIFRHSDSSTVKKSYLFLVPTTVENLEPRKGV
jgi:hypothetical protein